MKKFTILILILLVTLVYTLSVYSQESAIDCNNIDPSAAELADTLQNSVASPADLIDVVIKMREIFLVCDVVDAEVIFLPLDVYSDNAEIPPEIEVQLGLARSNPVPVTEWFNFAGGQVRVVSVENYQVRESDSYSIPEGMRVIAVNVEYLCEKEDNNQSCHGLEIGLVASYITADGIVLLTAPIYNDENISVTADGHEVYPGAVIKGRIYFAIDAGATPNIMRLDARINPAFFELGEVIESVVSVEPPTPTTAPPSPTTIIISSTPQPPTDIPAPTATQTPSKPMAIVNSGANVRRGPSTSFEPPVGSIAANQESEIIAVNPARDWYKIKYYNSEAWIFAQLVDTTGDLSSLPVDLGPPTPIPPTPVPPTAVPPPTAIPDPVNLYVVNIQISPHPLKCLDTGEIQITVGNNGTANTQSGGKILVEAVLVSTGAVLESTVTIFGPIAAGSQETVSASLTVATNYDELQRIRVTLDTDGQVAENNENDNRTDQGTDYILKKGDC